MMDSSLFKVSLVGKVTIVEFISRLDIHKFFQDSETGELRPHGNKKCDCVDVIHAETFRLRTVASQYLDYCSQTHKTEIDLYILCKPTDSKYKSTGMYHSKRVSDRINTALIRAGWCYLYTIPYSADNDIMRISLNLYKDRTSKIPVFSASKKICDILSELLVDGTYSDVTVSSNEGITIKAHRCILAKRCEVFRAALEHNETKDEITSHFNEETLRKIMTYIYTDEAPKIGDFTSDLFMAADYYQLSALKDVCQSAFYQQLKVENAVATLELAERHSLTDLMTFTLKFIKKNFGLIIDTEDWKNVKSLSLVKMVCEFNAPKSLSKASQSK